MAKAKLLITMDEETKAALAKLSEEVKESMNKIINDLIKERLNK